MEYDVYNNSNIRDDIAEKKIVKGNVAFFTDAKIIFQQKMQKRESTWDLYL